MTLPDESRQNSADNTFRKDIFIDLHSEIRNLRSDFRVRWDDLSVIWERINEIDRNLILFYGQNNHDERIDIYQSKRIYKKRDETYSKIKKLIKEKYSSLQLSVLRQEEKNYSVFIIQTKYSVYSDCHCDKELEQLFKELSISFNNSQNGLKRVKVKDFFNVKNPIVLTLIIIVGFIIAISLSIRN